MPDGNFNYCLARAVRMSGAYYDAQGPGASMN
jgi:hypothetical protein